jgi:hypothetical protein
MNEKALTYTKQTGQNRDLIPQAIEMIRNKSKNLEEISAAPPFLNEQPAFEHAAFNFSNLVKTADRFYENEIIGFQKSIFEESVYKIRHMMLALLALFLISLLFRFVKRDVIGFYNKDGNV